MSAPTQKQIEKTFRRLLGPTAEQRAAIKKVNDEADWLVRCWNCKSPQTVRLNALRPCEVCGKDLGKRS